MVLIDDHWSDSQAAPPPVISPDNIVLTPPPVPLADQIVVHEEIPGEVSSPTSIARTDPAYLRDIGIEIANQGFLFTGFSYTDAKKETVFELASKSDILILDWLLGSGNPIPALDLLERLGKSGSPRFIFILTDQSDLGNIRKNISERLGEKSEGTGHVFSCGPFSFSIKNKPHNVGGNSVSATEVLNEAVKGIQQRFAGLLQLAALQLLSRYKEKLHEVLMHFNSELDLPFITEWLEENSPIGPNSRFRDLMIDEWRSLVEQDHSPEKSILSGDGISAFIASKASKPRWGGKSAKRVYKILDKQKDKFPTEGVELTELEKEIQDWMGDCRSMWPNLTKPRGIIWKPGVLKTMIGGYLSIACETDLKHQKKLVDLDAFFHSKSDLPPKLDQGTVLIDPAGTYLVCITPTCDCSRPKERIKNCYVFLRANKVNFKKLKNYPEGVVVAVRSKEGLNLLLAVTPNPTFTYRIVNPSLERNLRASNTFKSKSTFVLKPVAQLRPTRVQALISLAAGKSIEIGLDRSELLRQLCRSN